MSKIICDVCGTSYPEASVQCPICGCVRSADAQNIVVEGSEKNHAAPYQHVKGGRFSKANVRKRIANPQNPVREVAANRTQPVSSNSNKSAKKGKSGNLGLLITIFVLLIAILLVIAYIALQLLGGFSARKPAETDAPETSASESITEPEILCQQILLSGTEYSLEKVGQKASVKASLAPENTTQKLMYASDNEAVVTVDDLGIMTATGFGNATITLQCGDITAECYVVVMPPFEIDETAITLDTEGQELAIYSGMIDANEITWTSDDPTVATIENGVVTAIGAGTTTVHGEYNGTTLSCTVECNIVVETEPQETESTEQTQAPTDAEVAKGPYTLKNLMGGRNDDVSLTAGESFRLALVDANGDTVSNVSWSVKNGSACTVSDGTVKAVASGYAEVVATYNGETFVCIVRVR